MRRGHRSVHFLIWASLFPVVFAAGLFLWLQRPDMPTSPIPDAIVTHDRSAQ